MKIIKVIAVVTVGLAWNLPAYAEDNKVAEPQVVHCGIKDGKPKEYGTKSAAEADGATHITIKTGKDCPALE